MNKTTACSIALGVFLLVFCAYAGFPTIYNESTAQQGQSPTYQEIEPTRPIIEQARSLPTITVEATQEIAEEITVASLLPTVTPTPPKEEKAIVQQVEVTALPVVEVAAAPALAPVSTPDLVVVPTPQAAVVIAAADTSLPVASSGFVPEECQVTGVPLSLNLDPFYTKYCSAYGIPIVASDAVSDAALQRAGKIVTRMLDGMSQAATIRDSINSTLTRIGIIATDQVTTDMPEHRNLYAMFPGVDWDTRTRGVGATAQIPLLSIAEENLLCAADDRWIGQNILVHEFAHTIKNLGLDRINPAFHAELQQVYQNALGANLWANTYAASSIEEYWAEGVRIYFQLSIDPNTPGILPYLANTRAELQSYDPELYRMVERIFDQPTEIPPCP